MAVGSLAEQHLALIPLLYVVTIAPSVICLALIAGCGRAGARARSSPRRHDGTAARARVVALPAGLRRAARRRAGSRLSATLSRYLGRQVLIGIGFALFGLALVALVVDTVELLRRDLRPPRRALRHGAADGAAAPAVPGAEADAVRRAVRHHPDLPAPDPLARAGGDARRRGLGLAVPARRRCWSRAASACSRWSRSTRWPRCWSRATRRSTTALLSQQASLIAVAPGGLWLRQPDARRRRDPVPRPADESRHRRARAGGGVLVRRRRARSRAASTRRAPICATATGSCSTR